jgi:hypothetical protein
MNGLRHQPEVPMSRRTLLSSEQRTRLFGIPTDAAGMAKYYVLSADDLRSSAPSVG